MKALFFFNLATACSTATKESELTLKLRVVACEVVRSGFQFFSCLHCPKKKTWRQMKKKLTLLDHQKTFEDNFQNKMYWMFMSSYVIKMKQKRLPPHLMS